MKVGLDTNILVRYLTQDDPNQAKKANKLMDNYINKKQSLFINNIVFCELIWVLERGYKYSRQQIAGCIKNLLCSQEFAFEHLDVLWISLQKYDKENMDFADVLISELNATYGCIFTYSFDNKASRLPNFKLL